MNLGRFLANEVMKTQITIAFWWDKENGEEIEQEHRDALIEAAQERIFSQVQEGFTGGELHDNIRMHDSDPEEGVSYHGWWEMDMEKTG